MFDYEELVDKVYDMKCGDEVEESEEVISAYSLWLVIQKEVSRINHLLYDNTEMLDTLNEMYHTVHILGDFLSKEAYENLDVHVPFFKQLKFYKMTSVYDGDETGIVYIYPDGKKNINKRIIIRKDFHYDEYYRSDDDNVNKFLVYGMPAFADGIYIHLDEIMRCLEFMSKNELFGYNGHRITTDTFTINMRFTFSEYSSPLLYIGINDDIDKYHSQTKRYLHFDTTIQEEIDKIQDTILKRIPVKVADLDKGLASLVKRNMGDILRGDIKIYEKNKTK
ncbi:MAG: hypothetical protein IKF47_00025 [Bacilli bacterium]|nr:hypothetical protein [Bacilli bacterium]